MKKIKEQGRFRPRIGDYFFIGIIDSVYYGNVDNEFPSPYWGLFFYLPILH